jgi:hypothetical protein
MFCSSAQSQSATDTRNIQRLGISETVTTQIYLDANLAMKEEILEKKATAEE